MGAFAILIIIPLLDRKQMSQRFTGLLSLVGNPSKKANKNMNIIMIYMPYVLAWKVPVWKRNKIKKRSTSTPASSPSEELAI
jgi:hypothetical protein